MYVDGSKRLPLGPAWGAFLQAKDNSLPRSDPFFRTDCIGNLAKIARVLVFSTFEYSQPNRIRIERTDRSLSEPHQKLEIQCTTDKAYELVSLILVAASNKVKIFGVMPSMGLEKTLGLTLEYDAVLELAHLSIHFPASDIDREAVSKFLQCLFYANIMNELTSARLRNETPPKIAQRWIFQSSLKGSEITTEAENLSMDQCHRAYLLYPTNHCKYFNFT